MKVKNRKTHVVTISTTASGYSNNSITYNFKNISFIPDEMIVRSVSVINNTGTRECAIVYTNLVSDNICSFVCTQTNTTNNQLDNRFIIGKEVSGNYVFTLLDENKAIVAMNDMVITITLEFVEY